jgi:hypothetical protein
MKASGLFFLSSRPYIVHAISPTDGEVRDWLLPLVERTDRGGVQKVVAHWRGVDAAKFVQEHAATLKAGQAISLEIDRIRPDTDCIRARVLSCTLAPDRWPAQSKSV